MSDPLSLELCRAVAGWRFEDLSTRVVRRLTLCLADTLGVIGGAARAAGIGALNERLVRWEPGGSATALIGHRRLSPPSAALANAAAAHALDFDDIHDEARVHSGCVILPAVLACAEDLGRVSGPISGRELLLALAAGFEVHARLGLAGSGSLLQGWHPTTVFGAMAGAVAVAKLMRLDGERMAHALGLAFHQTSGSAQSAYDGVLAKRLGPGFAARDAVLSAALAADGLTGTPHALEGRAGFFSLYLRDEVQSSAVLEGLGHDWQIARYSLKPYPACRCNHGVIALGIALHREAVRAESIVSAEILMSEANVSLVGQAYEASRDSVVHAQFNAAYSFARAVIDGRVGPLAYERPAITEPRVVDLAARVLVRVDPSMPREAMAPVRVNLRTVDGRERTLSGDTLKGSPEEPMSDDEMRDKLRACFNYGMAAPELAADRVGEVALSIDTADDAAALLVRVFPSSSPV